MSLKRKLNVEKISSLDISNKPQCECGCKKCETENKFLREKIIELYNILEKKITRQSFSSSFNGSLSGPQTPKEESTKGCSCKKSCSARCGCYKKNLACGKRCKCDKNSCKNMIQEHSNDQTDHNESVNSSIQKPKSPITKRVIKNNAIEPDKSGSFINFEQDENFDPMKPRHQLPRSPIPIKNSLSVTDNFIQSDPEPHSTPLSNVSNVDISLANASIKSMANDLPEELQQPIVDWEKHKAELKKCPKCNRTFLPNRLLKHKAICKGI